MAKKMINVNQKRKIKTKGKKQKLVKADKKRNRSKDEKAAERTKRFLHRFFSLFCVCFTRQERNNQNNETKQSTAEKTRTQYTSQISFVTIDHDLNN